MFWVLKHPWNYLHFLSIYSAKHFFHWLLICYTFIGSWNFVSPNVLKIKKSWNLECLKCANFLGRGPPPQTLPLATMEPRSTCLRCSSWTRHTPPWKNPSTQFMHLSGNCTQLFMKPVSVNIYWRVVCNVRTGHFTVCCARSHQSSSLLLMSQPTSLAWSHSSWSLLIKAVSLSMSFIWPSDDLHLTLFWPCS